MEMFFDNKKAIPDIIESAIFQSSSCVNLYYVFNLLFNYFSSLSSKYSIKTQRYSCFYLLDKSIPIDFSSDLVAWKML